LETAAVRMFMALKAMVGICIYGPMQLKAEWLPNMQKVVIKETFKKFNIFPNKQLI
jgi:hypothetical protein